MKYALLYFHNSLFYCISKKKRPTETWQIKDNRSWLANSIARFADGQLAHLQTTTTTTIFRYSNFIR